MKTNNTSASASTVLADVTETTVLTQNLDNSMQSENFSNPDNLFDNEPTATEVTTQPKPQRIGKQQRKLNFSDFKETFLIHSKLEKRHSVNIEESVWEQLERVARILGDRGSNVVSYINAILTEHLKTYASDIEVWRKL